MLRKLTAIGAAAALMALAAAPASATVYNDYSGSGSVDGCSYSADELRNALANVPPDIQQYDPGYVDSLNGALADQASGACDPASAGAGAGAGGAPSAQNLSKDGSPKPTAAPAEGRALAAAGAPVDLSAEKGFPAALAVLAGIFALVLVAGAVIAIGRPTAAAAPGAGERGSRGRGGFRGALSDYWWGIRERFRR